MHSSKDIKRFAEVMAGLSEIFDSGGKMTPVKVELYFRALEKYSIEAIEAAAKSMIATRTYATFPKPAEFNIFLDGDQQDKALLAWEKVHKAIGEVGGYQSVKFDDPIIHSCIELMGGWIYVSGLDTKEMKWVQKDFISAYKSLALKPAREHPDRLIGMFEQDNAPRFPGYNGETVLIGNHKRELKVIENRT